MTSLQVAKCECANCDSTGNCSGVAIADDLSCYLFRRPGKCYLAEQPIRPCTYFEQCVAPAAKARLREATTQEQKRAAASLADGVSEYELAVMAVPVSAKFRCASNGCRRTVRRPARYCPKHGKNGSRTAEIANFAHSR
jgi:hypothetical protein